MELGRDGHKLFLMARILGMPPVSLWDLLEELLEDPTQSTQRASWIEQHNPQGMDELLPLSALHISLPQLGPGRAKLGGLIWFLPVALAGVALWLSLSRQERPGHSRRKLREGAAPSLHPNNGLDLCFSAWGLLENHLLPASGHAGKDLWDKREQTDPGRWILWNSFTCAMRIPGAG